MGIYYKVFLIQILFLGQYSYDKLNGNYHRLLVEPKNPKKKQCHETPHV